MGKEDISKVASKISSRLVKKDKEGNIYLGDEISPDTCRLWDINTQKKLDKDRFRRDLGEVEEAYQEIIKRIKG